MLSARHASTAALTLRKLLKLASRERGGCQFDVTYRPCFTRTTSSMTSLSRFGNIPQSVLAKRC